MKPTNKQLNFIMIIENEVGVEFEGTTKEEASKYIKDNIALYRLFTTDTWALENGYE